MATVKKEMLTACGEWWRHLRGTKREFWKGERRAAKKFAQREVASDACKDRDRV
jgi:pullulanase/glycogen debranching enzyme